MDPDADFIPPGGHECSMCTPDGTSHSEYLTRLLAGIKSYGWMVQAVTGVNPYAYTIGLAAKGQPELVIAGVSPGDAHAILNALALNHYHLRLIANRRQVAFGIEFRLAPVDPLTIAAQMPIVATLYGEDATALQVMWADPNGRFPGDPQCTLPTHQQTIG